MLICVLKKSNLLILCLETMLPNKSKILQMIIKSLISCSTRIDRGTDPPMQTGATHVDAFTVSWREPLTYCFPPFSLLGRCLQKIAMDQAECILLIPNWPTQPYYSKVIEMLVSLPLVLPCQPQLLQLPHDPHRRHTQLQNFNCWHANYQEIP